MSKQASVNLQKTDYFRHRLDLYRQAAKDVIASNSGLLRYALEVFGPDLIGSWAFALDPYKQFRNLPNRVALLTDGPKVVRERRRITSPLSNRKEIVRTVTHSYSYQGVPGGGAFNYIYTGPNISHVDKVKTRADQPPLFGLSRDTTYRTRTKGVDQGEFEIFSPRITSVPRAKSWLRSDSFNYNSIGTGQRSQVQTWVHSRWVGPEFRTTDANVQLLLPGIRTRALNTMSKNVYKMLDEVQPRYKSFSLAYQIAELRELPLTLKSTLEIWLSFERAIGTEFFRSLQRIQSNWRDPDLMRFYSRSLGRFTGFQYDELLSLDRNAASAYLSFKFGWESIYRGIVDFLPSPHRVARDINRLLDSIGVDRSRRSRRRWEEPETSFPQSTVNFLEDEMVVDSTVRYEGQRKIELRLVASFIINFPSVDIPHLRKELFLRRLGATPSVSDLYNLVPWTWLVDWFTGAGDYVSLVDSLANDRSIINYGFLTYREESETTASVKGRFRTRVSRTVDGVGSVVDSFEHLTHQGKFKYVYQLRRSIPSITNVRSYWDENLNDHQTAIIGALLSTNNRSPGRRDAS